MSALGGKFPFLFAPLMRLASDSITGPEAPTTPLPSRKRGREPPDDGESPPTRLRLKRPRAPLPERQCNWCRRCLQRLTRLSAADEPVYCHHAGTRARCEYCVSGNRKAADCVVVPEELQEEAASVVSLYQEFLGGNAATSLGDVVSAARHLCDQFRVATRRAPARVNAALGELPSRSAQAPSAVPALSEETGDRIATALEAIAALLARAHGLASPLEENSSAADEA
ncbi:MAG: hypothetical protein Q9187_009531 [Circinaria calcarea]